MTVAWRRWRGLLAAWTVLHLAPRLPHLEELYCRPVLRDDVLDALHPVLGAVGPPPWAAVAALFAVALGAAPAWGAGLAPRASWALGFGALAAITALDPISAKAYGYLALVQWGLAGFAPARGPVPAWLVRLVVAQWASVYLLSIGAKLSEPAWRNGSALWLALNNDDFGRFLLSSRGITHGWSRALTWGTVALEAGIGLGVWHPRTRPLAVGGCLALHAGILLTMRISPLFAALMWLHLPLVLALGAGQRDLSGVREAKP